MNNNAKRQGGVVMIVVATALLALLGMAALSVDVGWVMTTRTQLQGAADSAALAAMSERRSSGTEAMARTEAIGIAGVHEAGGESVDIAGGDVVFGFYDHATRNFSAGFGFGAPAVRVGAGRTNAYAAGPLNLFFAPLLGRTEMDVAIDAVASIRRRDLVLVQDRTPSFQDEFPSAQAADVDLVQQMGAQAMPGDQMALISFARDAIREQDLIELSGGGETQLITAINAMVVCTSAGPPGGPCYGTDIAVGIDEAVELLDEQSPAEDSERVMVIVSDGVPCLIELGGAAVSMGEQLATEAADRADAAGVNIFTITLLTGTSSGFCHSPNPTFNESLARGFGQGYTTTNEDDLDDLLTLILTQMPVQLVH